MFYSESEKSYRENNYIIGINIWLGDGKNGKIDESSWAIIGGVHLG